MGKKPKFGVTFGRQAGIPEGRAYFLARFFGFFFAAISSRVLTGIASMRRAISSSGILAWESSSCFAVLVSMVGARYG